MIKRKGSLIIWSAAVFLLVLLSLGYFAFRIRPLMAETVEMQNRIDDLLRRYSAMVEHEEGPPSEIRVKAVQEEIALKEETFREIKGSLSADVPELIPEGTRYPAIYWMDTLRRKRAQLDRLASESGLRIPSGLGFRDSMPSEAEVPGLMFRLFVVEELINLAAESGLRAISTVEMGSGEDVRSAGEVLFRKAPVTFSIETREITLASIFKFIELLEQGSLLYVIDDMRIRVRTLTREEESRRPAARTARQVRDVLFEDELNWEDDGEIIYRSVRESFLNIDLRVSIYFEPPEEGYALTPADPERF